MATSIKSLHEKLRADSGSFQRLQQGTCLRRKKDVIFLLSLTLSLAREEEEDQAKDRRGPRRTPPDGCVVVVVVVVLSTDRPKGKEKERKREMPRRPEKKIVVMVAKGIMCWRENRVEFKKTIKKVSIASSSLFFPPSTKKKKTRAIYSPRRTSLFFSRTPEKTKKTKTCRSLSLSFRLEALSSKASFF